MNISKITVDSSTHALRPYGECTTAAATAAKVVTCTDFTTLYTGATILVNFKSANTASAPTLDVNGTGAKSVISSGSIPVTALSGQCEFVYNGTGWVVLSTGRIAALGTDGKILSSALPSYVDEVIEGYYNPADKLFYKESGHTNKISGEKNKVYVDITNNSGDVFRYSGSTFVKITSSPDHKHSYTKATGTSATTTTVDVAAKGHTHSVTVNEFTPAGKIAADSTNTASVSTSAHTHPVSVNGNTLANESSVAIPTSTHTHTVTAIGTIGAPTYKDTEGTQIARVASAGHKHTFSGEQSTTLANGTDKADVAAQGHTHTFSGTEVDSGSKAITSSAAGGVLTLTTTHTHKVTAKGSVATTKTTAVSASLGTHTHSYTPKGSIAAPATGTAANFTDVASTAHIHVFTGSSVTSSGPSATGKAAAVTHKHSISIGTTATANSTAVATVSTAAHTHTFTGKTITGLKGTAAATSTAAVSVATGDHTHTVTTTTTNTGSSTDN